MCKELKGIIGGVLLTVLSSCLNPQSDPPSFEQSGIISAEDQPGDAISLQKENPYKGTPWIIEGMDLQIDNKKEVKEKVVGHALGFGSIDFKNNQVLEINIKLPNGEVSGGSVRVQIGDGDGKLELDEIQAFQTADPYRSTVLGIHDGIKGRIAAPLEGLRMFVEETSVGQRPDPQKAKDNLESLKGSMVEIVDEETKTAEKGIIVNAKIAPKEEVYENYAHMEEYFDLGNVSGRNTLFITTCSQLGDNGKGDNWKELYPGQIVFAVQKAKGEIADGSGRALSKNERKSMQRWLRSKKR